MKDRAAPFSKKHRRYWLPVTGGMFLIMGVNVGLGWWIWTGERAPQPAPQYQPIPPVVLRPDAGVDAAP